MNGREKNTVKTALRVSFFATLTIIAAVIPKEIPL